jgi:hypothetical protein
MTLANMNTTINSIQKSKKKTSKKIDVLIPQLLRVKLIQIQCVCNPNPNKQTTIADKQSELHANIKRAISAEVLKKSNGDDGCRIRVSVKIDGTWSNQVTETPRIVFSGQYEAQFSFPEGVNVENVLEWMEEKSYREGVVAQVIPVVNLHMYSQLEMMGVNSTTRSLGIPSSLMLEKTKRSKVSRLGDKSTKAESTLED